MRGQTSCGRRSRRCRASGEGRPDRKTEKPVEQKTVFSNISEEIGVQADTDFWRPQISGVRSESLSVQTLTGTSGSDERIAGFCPSRPLKARDCGLKSHPSGNCRTSDQ